MWKNVGNDGNASRFIFLAEHERFRIKLSLFKCQGVILSVREGFNKKTLKVMEFSILGGGSSRFP